MVSLLSNQKKQNIGFVFYCVFSKSVLFKLNLKNRNMRALIFLVETIFRFITAALLNIGIIIISSFGVLFLCLLIIFIRPKYIIKLCHS